MVYLLCVYLFFLVFHPIGIAVDAVDKQRESFIAGAYLFLIRKRLVGLALAALDDPLGNIHNRILDEIIFFLYFVAVRVESRVVPTHLLHGESHALGTCVFTVVGHCGEKNVCMCIEEKTPRGKNRKSVYDT